MQFLHTAITISYPHHLLNPYHFPHSWEDSSLLRMQRGAFTRFPVVLIKACLHWSYMQFSGSNSWISCVGPSCSLWSPAHPPASSQPHSLYTPVMKILQEKTLGWNLSFFNSSPHTKLFPFSFNVLIVEKSWSLELDVLLSCPNAMMCPILIWSSLMNDCRYTTHKQ